MNAMKQLELLEPTRQRPVDSPIERTILQLVRSPHKMNLETMLNLIQLASMSERDGIIQQTQDQARRAVAYLFALNDSVDHESTLRQMDENEMFFIGAFVKSKPSDTPEGVARFILRSFFTEYPKSPMTLYLRWQIIIDTTAEQN